MWEDATRKTTHADAAQTEQGKQPAAAAPRRKGSDALLWMQIVLCLILLTGVALTKMVGHPAYRILQRAFYAGLEAPSLLSWEDGQHFAKFTQETAAELWAAARQVMADWQASQPATAETASVRPVRRANERAAPSGSSLDPYVPSFAVSYPLPFVVSSVTSGYGWRIDPVSGEGTEFHTGADLPVAEGTQVLAAADGVVRVAGTHSSYGNYVRILHPNGDETLYAHMQYIYVRAGQKVERGQVLGTSGQTGNVTGPHLHFELLHGGVRYDPTEALQQAAG